MRTFAVVNQKGGCGKTTTAINLAGVFASRGLRTLLVDMDPQGHCAAGLAIPEARIDLTVGDAMLAVGSGGVDPKRLLWRVMRNLDLIPATVRLAALEAARGDLASRPDAERLLRTLVRGFAPDYDVCLIDCSPAIGLLAFNAMTACDEVLIPVETGFFSLHGATKQINAIKSLGKRLGVAPVHHLLPTMHDPASALSQDLLDELRRRFGARVLPVVIRFDHALREAASFGQPVIEYAPDSSGAADYTALADVLTQRLSNPPASSPADTPADAGPRFSVVHVESDDVLRLGAHTAEPDGAGPIISATAPISRHADLANLARRVQDPSLAPSPTSTPTPTVVPARSSPTTPSAAIAQTALSSAIGASTTLAADAAPPAETALDRLGITAQPASVLAEPKLTAAAVSPSITPPDTRSRLAAPRPAFGVTPLDDGLLFVQPASLGHAVAVAGDFNNWKPERTPLRPGPDGQTLEHRMVCPPGMYQYRVVVDGQWMPDPFNPHTAANPFGGSNSVAIVPMRLAPAARPSGPTNSGEFR